jgi:hypothetical protein
MRHRLLSLALPALVLALAGAITPRQAHAQWPPDTVRFTEPLEANELVLWGVVRDEATGKPLARVHIAIDSTSLGAMTDGAGRYVIRHVEGQPRPVVLRVRALSLARGKDFYPEERVIDRSTPWSGARSIVSNGHEMPITGYAARLDFRLRERPSSF